MQPTTGTPYLVGLTGSIGSGKSTVAQMLEALGATLIDADVLAREAVSRGSEGLRRVVQTFGTEYLDSSGDLDRKKLGGLVFGDKHQKDLLEKIIHPAVRKLFLREFKKVTERNDGALVVSVIPLLFESGSIYSELQKVIVVSAPKEACLERIIRRDGCEPELALKKYEAQMPIQEKERRADFVVNNAGDLQSLELKVTELHAKLKQLMAEARAAKKSS